MISFEILLIRNTDLFHYLLAETIEGDFSFINLETFSQVYFTKGDLKTLSSIYGDSLRIQHLSVIVGDSELCADVCEAIANKLPFVKDLKSLSLLVPSTFTKHLKT
jgi:hypothetical protein